MLSFRKHGEFDKYTKENFTKCHLLTSLLCCIEKARMSDLLNHVFCDF